jgi:hypothetical protein
VPSLRGKEGLGDDPKLAAGSFEILTSIRCKDGRWDPLIRMIHANFKLAAKPTLASSF